MQKVANESWIIRHDLAVQLTFNIGGIRAVNSSIILKKKMRFLDFIHFLVQVRKRVNE